MHVGSSKQCQKFLKMEDNLVVLIIHWPLGIVQQNKNYWL